jgi:5'-nucleotidase
MGKSAKKPLIFLTNDDGFFSEGIEALFRSLRALGRVFIVAPDRERSATSLSLTLRRPLRVQRIKPNVYAVDGTPADCVYLAAQKLLPRKPDLLVSGLNTGPNLGQQDISYSGTVAAALQGSFLRIPSIALSVIPDVSKKFHFDFAAQIVSQLVKRLLKTKLPQGVTLNVNIPPPPFKGVKITSLGQKRYNPEIIEKKDPRQNTYYWIGTGNPVPSGGKDSDIAAISRGYVSITPLHTDLTDYRTMKFPQLQRIILFPL